MFFRRRGNTRISGGFPHIKLETANTVSGPPARKDQKTARPHATQGFSAGAFHAPDNSFKGTKGNGEWDDGRPARRRTGNRRRIADVEALPV